MDFPTFEAGEIAEELLMPDEADYTEQLNQSPLQDVVRMWEAPYNGVVKVGGVVKLLLDSIPDSYKEWDGVRVAIEFHNDELWAQEITIYNNASYSPSNVNHINVKKGERLYFRLQSNVNGMYDFIEWNPTVEYINMVPDISKRVDVNNKPYFKFDAQKDFLLSWPGSTGFPASGKVNVTSRFSKPITTDEVFIEYFLVDTLSEDSKSLIRKERFAWNEEVNAQDINFLMDVEGSNHALYIRIKSNSNIDWPAFKMQTSIVYVESFDAEISLEELNKEDYIVVPHIITYDSTLLENIENYNSFIVPEKGRITLTPLISKFEKPFGNPEVIKYYDVRYLTDTVNFVVKREGVDPIVKKIDRIYREDSLFVDIEVEKGEIVNIESFTESNNAFDLVFDEFKLAFIIPDTLLLDSITVKSIKVVENDTLIEEHKELWYRKLSKNEITDSILIFNSEGEITDTNIEIYSRDSQPYFDFINELLPRTDSVIDQIDTLITTIHTREIKDYINKTYGEKLFIVRKHLHKDYNEYGNGYKGWGQFSYNNIAPSYAEEPIRTGELVLKENTNTDLGKDNLDLNIDETKDYDLNARGAEDKSGTKTSSPLSIMYPNNHLNSWVGADSTIYITPTIMSSSRKGDKELIAYEAYAEIAKGASNMRGVVKKAKSGSTIYNLGASVGIADGYFSLSGSLARTSGNTYMQSDFMDMNGDGYPDILSNGQIQYSLPWGSLGEFKVSLGGDVTKSESETTGISVNGSIPTSKAKNQNVAKYSLTPASPGLSKSSDEDEYTFFDINGDGLPDKVYRSGMVQLNYGYFFGEDEEWFKENGVRVVEALKVSLPVGLDIGLPINKGNGSFTAGVNYVSNKSHANVQYVDVNGDGLPDRVETTTGNNPKTTIQFNTGSGFTSKANGFEWEGTVQRQHNINASANTAVTFGFTPFVWPIKFVFNPSVEFSQSFSRTTEQLMDLDGDGYPDFVTSGNSDELQVRYSKIGKTNMLEKVNLPLGASFTLDYGQTQNSFEMPSRQWMLTEVELNDNHAGDGVDVTRSEFEYGEGFYDRYERTFYGFDKVISKQIDTGNNNALYRKVEEEFENKSYYTQGMMVASKTTDGAGNIYSVTQNNYLFRVEKEVKTADALPNYSKGDLTVFPYLTSTVNYFYEGTENAEKTYRNEFEYDEKGNITEYRDLGDVEAGDKPIIGKVEYHANSNKHIYNIPSSIAVSSGGEQYRKRETKINDKGQITHVRHYISEADYSEVELEYNSYGNISKKTMPANYKDERMFFNYTYDEKVHSYITQVSDAFGYSSTTEYDYRYGAPTRTIDLNNQPMEFAYDGKGRLTTIIGSKEIESGAPFTIAHSYSPEAAIAYGTTQHYDAAHPGNTIETAIFTDPLGRVLQTKRDATILASDNVAIVNKEEPQFAEVMIVSGKVIYDAFGRVVKTYYPTHPPTAPRWAAPPTSKSKTTTTPTTSAAATT